MSISKYNSEGYPDPTAHGALEIIEQEENALRAFRSIVYICSPYAGAKHIMQNEHYLGDDFYPAIINKETFHTAGVEIRCRSAKLGRDDRYKAPEAKKAPILFRFKDIKEYYDNSVKQAEYLYSLIESEVI